jgi:hypothetical protein
MTITLSIVWVWVSFSGNAYYDRMVKTVCPASNLIFHSIYYKPQIGISGKYWTMIAAADGKRAGDVGGEGGWVGIGRY